MDLKLKIDLVPSTAWYSNLRNNIAKSNWDIIRKKSYEDAGNKCAICKSEGKLNCHELWDYDDKTQVQTLRGFIALCNSCHMIKHIGFAGIQASQGNLDMDQLINHFIKVNGVTEKVFKEHYDSSFELWRKRSEHEWRTDLAEWKSLVKSKKEA